MANRRLTRRSLLAGIGGAGVARTVLAQTPAATPPALRRIPRLRIGIASRPDVIAPHLATDLDAMWLSSLVYDAPIRWNANGAVIPGVFTTTADSKSSHISMQPRMGVFFADGAPVLSRHAVERLRSIRNSSHAWRLQQVDEITETEDGIMRINMHRADAALMAHLSHPLFGLDDEQTGSGPFALAAMDGTVATYRRNPNFWQVGRPHIDQLDVVQIADDIQRSTAIATGEIDILPNVPLLDVPMLANEPTLYLVGGPSNRLCHLQLRLSEPVLRNQRVRQILSAAIDRAGLVAIATANQADIATTLFAGDTWTDGADGVKTMSPEDVRSQLRALGVPSDLRLHLLTDNADSSLANTAVILQGQLASCGISLSITLLEGKELEEAKAAGSYDLLVSYSEPWRDPHELVCPLLSTEGSLNWSGFANVEVDTLLEAANTLSDLEFRRARYSRLETIIQKNVPVIPLFRPFVWDAVNVRFPGYAALPAATSRGLMTLVPTDT